MRSAKVNNIMEYREGEITDLRLANGNWKHSN